MLAKCEDTIYIYYSCGEQYWTKWNAVIKQTIQCTFHNLYCQS